MDRRQRRTRGAILAAFGRLLSRKSYSRITVREIIEASDVGRTTFYSHFAAKDDLLDALCGELFGHIAEAARSHTHGGGAGASVFCHLLHHIKEDDGVVLKLLACENGDLFLRRFKESLRGLVEEHLAPSPVGAPPRDFVVDHIASSFVESALWWIRGGLIHTPEEIDGYFRASLAPTLLIAPV